ncbi:hypothetical protein PCA31118_00045 [Pandoraea captiosa]|uniref:Uncharacterized protein n=2 Tax=Pandoraea captiosa TaxID=2508302 RepID=A0A5E4ZFU1_9BURK|nr:hypothetical protein PCA31118_00045 [Pandoraea captiosa]
MYRIPETYWNPDGVAKGAKLGEVKRPGPAAVDVDLLRVASAALEEWLQQKAIDLPPARKADIVAVLYDYLAKGANPDEMARMLRALAA